MMSFQSRTQAYENGWQDGFTAGIRTIRYGGLLVGVVVGIIIAVWFV